MFKTIVVPTDGSEHAKKAVELAADLSEKYGTQLLVLHVLLRQTSASDLRELCTGLNASDSLITKIDELEDALQDTAFVDYGGLAPIILSDEVLTEVGDLILIDAKTTAETQGAADVSVVVADGDAADCILAIAEQDEADLIVMGSRGLGKFADLLMGSVSHKVSHLSKCSCVTVK